MFLRKCSTIIVGTSIALWLLLNLPLHSTVDRSLAAGLGRLAQPLFAPLGFDWQVTVAVISAQAARETFVATINQEGGAAGLATPTVAALLVWFVYALQCMSTVAALRRETGGWRWPLTALAYLTTVAWVMAFVVHAVVVAATG
jgi:ferrous iron transport protein B